MVASTLENEDQTIGGPGIIVEVDESKVAKRKNNRGHRVERTLVFGGVELTDERKMFLIEVSDRSAATLLLFFARSSSSRIYPSL